MTDRAGTILVGLSGGADSMCLLDLMARYTAEHGLRLKAIHVHHGIRGEEADRDEAFCRDFCAGRGIEFASVHCDVPGYAKEYGLSLEEAGRLLRYDAMNEEAGRLEEASEYVKDSSEAGATASRKHVVIAVAHHQDDQAETMLFHMCRGTDIRGLRGMLPVKGRLIRPLLCLGREEILAYCRKEEIPFVQDSTNEETEYTRNLLRKEVLPILKDKVNPHTVKHLAAIGERIGQVEDYLEQTTSETYRILAKEEREQGVLVAVLLTDMESLHPYLADRIFYRAASELLGEAKDLTAEHIARFRHLLEPGVQAGTTEDIRDGLVACKEQGGIYLADRGHVHEPEPEQGQLNFAVIDCRDAKACLEAGLDPELPAMSPRILRNDDYTKFLDYDKINNDLQLRHREEGDYLVLDEEGHKKSLNRCLIDSRIPQRMKDKLWVLADGHHIIWIVGGRISYDVRVTAETRTILKVDYVI